MWLGGFVEMEVWELAPGSVLTKFARTRPVERCGLRGNPRSLRFTPLALADAVARAGVTSLASDLQVRLRTQAKWFEIQSFIERDGTALVLVDNAMEMLRDSEGTAARGAFGQGICWMFGVAGLQARVYDFGDACAFEQVQRPREIDPRPDYVAYTAAGGRCLLESKGSWTWGGYEPAWKESLQEGLEQCAAGGRRLYDGGAGLPAASYAVYSNLQTRGPGAKSRVVFVDPPMGTKPPIMDEAMWPLERFHYAAWALAGWNPILADFLRGHGRRPTMEGFYAVLGGVEYFFPVRTYFTDRIGPRFTVEIEPTSGLAGSFWGSIGRGHPALCGLFPRGIQVGVLDALYSFRGRAIDSYIREPYGAEASDGNIFYWPDGTCVVDGDLAGREMWEDYYPQQGGGH